MTVGHNPRRSSDRRYGRRVINSLPWIFLGLFIFALTFWLARGWSGCEAGAL